MHVVFDTSVWLRGLLAKDRDSIGATLLRAVRDAHFVCVGSMALILELDEKLRTPRIASKLTLQQAREARELVFALLDPLTHISGERIGCDDPDDDHVLELAMNAKARFTVIRDDVFCGFVREQFLADEEYR